MLDVKSGSGAFLTGDQAARDLAAALVETANGAGCRTSALITDMDQPLARAAGNAVEVSAAIAVLKGEAGALRDLSLALSQECLALGGLDPVGAERALDSGTAAERFAAMVAAQGGPSDLLENPARLPRALIVCPVPAKGRVAAIDATALGRAVVALGGGRVQAGQVIDPTVGLTDMLRLGEEAGFDRPLAMVHARTEDAANAAIAAVQAAYQLGDAVVAGPLVRERIAVND